MNNHAPADLLALLAEVKRQREVIDAVVEAIDEYSDEAGWQDPVESFRFQERLRDITQPEIDRTVREAVA